MSRVYPKYPNTKIVEYSTILIIDILFRKNTLLKNQTNQRIEEENIKSFPHPSLSSGKPISLTEKLKGAHWGNPLQNYGCYLQLVDLYTL